MIWCSVGKYIIAIPYMFKRDFYVANLFKKQSIYFGDDGICNLFMLPLLT